MYAGARISSSSINWPQCYSNNYFFAILGRMKVANHHLKIIMSIDEKRL